MRERYRRERQCASNRYSSYVLKVTTAGKFFWPAPSAEAMYYPEIYGRGEEGWVVIGENR